ncbi:MAG: GNAT family N-acetyltransferase [Clostridia bacterium]|nr:GNAT family N-acetyltransferase [Clostridia bacterium]
MAVQRLCTMEDKPYLRALWQTCFGDSDSFMDFFFEKRFYPEYSVCTIEDEKLVNAMYSFPVNMYIRGNIVPAAMLAGFSTDPDYRGRGYMSKAFEILVNSLADSGITVAPHTPVKHENYFRQGNYTATDTRFIKGTADKPKIMPSGVNFGRMSEMGKLYPVYLKFAEKYSGTLARSMHDFRLKTADLASDGGEFIIAEKGGETKGYAMYFNGVEGLTAVETAYDSEETAESLLNALAFIADNKPIKIKFPPDSRAELAGCTSEIIPHGVAAAVNMPKLMNMIFKESGISIKLSDHISSINNGIFRMDGTPCEDTADLELEAGYFIQFAEGYKTLAELEKEGHAVINNREKAEYLDRKYPKCTCYICDEY